jgi:RES domain-containing protein
MLAYRLVSRRWATSAFSGNGAAENPGRWNRLGTRMVYCASSGPLAVLEVLGNTDAQEDLAHKHFVMITIDLPDALIYRPNKLPKNWRRDPIDSASQAFGSRFVEAAKHPFLRVPSANYEQDACLLLNPLHEDFTKIREVARHAYRYPSKLAR